MTERWLVIGDIHGRINALKQALDRANYNKYDDELIVLGDIADGGEDVKACMEYLSHLPYVTFVIGNHDLWFKKWVDTDGEFCSPLWLNQGGYATIKSYDYQAKNVPERHKRFLQRALPYFEHLNMLFVHGGFNPKKQVRGQPVEVLTWDRDLINYAKTKPIKQYDRVFIGHTTTELVTGKMVPATFNNLILMDTGAGWTGKLTVMDVQTGEYWQSDTQSPNMRQ